MTVGAIKKLLVLGNLGAVLALGGTGFFFYEHTNATPPKLPEFNPPPAGVIAGPVRIDAIPIQLGRFPRPEPVETKVEEEKQEEAIESVLGRLGEIIGAVTLFPPYKEGGFVPSLTFKFKNGDVRTIKLGEALMEVPHSNPALREAGYTEPKNYQFIRCEPHPERDGWVYFVFDMNCDGQDIQKAQWAAEGTRKKLPTTSDPTTRTGTGGNGVHVIDPAELTRAASAPKPEETKPTETVAVPEPPQPPLPEAVPGTLFEQEEDGRMAPTDEGIRYLEENYQKMIREASLRPYKDPKTGRTSGVHVARLPRNSAANQFGIREHDVILAINGRTVTRQSQAVSIVKSELEAKKRFIDVTIQRNGRKMNLQFDARDPETRRQARNLGRR